MKSDPRQKFFENTSKNDSTTFKSLLSEDFSKRRKMKSTDPKVRLQKFFEAASRNDSTTVKKLIEVDNMDPMTTDPFGRTIAHIATRRGNISLLKYLLAKAPHFVNMTDGYDQTLLHEAVESGSLKLVKYLVETYNYDIEQSRGDRFGDPSIHLAAQTGNLDIFKYFVEEKNANVNLKNSLGQPPAFTAALHAHLNIIKYIVEECKGDVTIIDTLGGNILYKSARKGDVSIPKYLLDDRKLDIDMNNRDTFGETVIHRAARINHTSFVKYFVGEKHANVNIQDNGGRTPLLLAASMNNLSVVKCLVKHGANVLLKDNTGQTPQQAALEENVIKFLEAETKKRVRRSVLSELFFPSVLQANPINAKWIQKAAIEGPLSAVEHSQSMDVDVNQIDGFLTLANSCLGTTNRRIEQQGLFSSPHDIMRNRIDPVAVDSVLIGNAKTAAVEFFFDSNSKGN